MGRVNFMRTYKFTAYEQTGKLIMDESIEASNDEEAKEKGQMIIEEKNLHERTHRLASPAGQLLLFHS